jgi:HEAT repeat protein
MMSSEDDPEVPRAIFIALGHQGQPEAIEPALAYRQHSDPQVRHAVVFALTGHDDPRAIKGLIELSRDDDTDVRDWATFGLGSQTDLDTPVLREALVERLTDSDQETRGEAMIGLAKRKDARAIPPICKELTSPNVAYQVFEAAQLVASSELLPQLLEWRDQYGSTDSQLADAIAACSRSTDAEKPDIQPWKQ